MDQLNPASLAQIEDRIQQYAIRAENAAIRAENAAGLRPPEPYKKVAPLL